MKTNLLLLLCCVAAQHIYAVKHYHGYQVWRVQPENDEHRRWLSNIENLPDAVDIWSHGGRNLGGTVDIMVPPRFQDKFSGVMATMQMTYDVMIANLEELLIDQEGDRQKNRGVSVPGKAALADFDYTKYHPLDEIQQWVDDFVTENSDIAEKFTVTTSYEGRPITGIKIRGTGNTVDKSPAVWFEGGIHAREWISPATVMFITNQLVIDYRGNDSLVMNLLDNMEWYIVPSLNVDGYVYTWTEDRMWRKTRSDNEPDTGIGCYGTDPNRNWPYKWGGEGTSAFPCSQVYHGLNALSEVEVKGVVDFLRDKKMNGQEFSIYIDWHSYTQVILAPWAFSTTEPLPVDNADQMAAGRLMQEAISNTHGVSYDMGPLATHFNSASSGLSQDWGYAPLDPSSNLKGGLGAKYSYIVELRDTGEYGFLLPEDQIQPTGEENYAAVLALGQYALDKP